MSKRDRYQNTGRNAETPDETAQDLYGLPDMPLTSSNPTRANRIPLGQIYADPTQPRRAVPPALRGAWDGSPDRIVDMLAAWRAEAAQRIGRPIDTHKLIMERDEQVLDNVDTTDAIALGYIKLVRLAASIYDEGLTNPPTVCREGDHYRLIAGERRFLAVTMLHAVTGDDKYSALPAFKADSPNVWKQASENNARDDLNAVGLARQLALLLIDLYSETTDFASYNSLVTPGGSDRAYYAQVADGNAFSVPYGEGQRVQDAMGIPNRSMISRYRRLLEMPDRLWLLGDNYDLTEYRLRHAMIYINESEWAEFADPRAASDAELLQYIDQAISDGKDDKQREKASRDAEMLPTGNIVPGDTMLPVGNNVSGDQGEKASRDAEMLPTGNIVPDGRPANVSNSNITPPTITRSGWSAGDRCTIRGFGPATITRVVSSLIVEADLDTGRKMQAIHESDLMTLRESTPLATPLAQSGIDRAALQPGVVVRITGGALARITQRLFDGNLCKVQFMDGTQTDISTSSIVSIADANDWDDHIFEHATPPASDNALSSASTDDDEDAAPPRRQPRVLTLDKYEAATVQRIGHYAEAIGGNDSLVGALVALFNGHLPPNTYKDALDDLTALHRAINDDMATLNKLINAHHGFNRQE